MSKHEEMARKFIKDRFMLEPSPLLVEVFAKALAQVEAETLERAAKVCEQQDDDGEGPDCWDWHAKDYAKAIRSLSPNNLPTPTKSEERKPDGYAYIYPWPFGKGEVTRFSNGEEYNGHKPLRAVPYWLEYPPPVVDTDVSVSGGLIDGWRPIETAPRDGTPILLIEFRAGKVAEVDVGCWELIQEGDWEGGETSYFGWGSELGHIENPSLWMPLPAAPNDGAEPQSQLLDEKSKQAARSVELVLAASEHDWRAMSLGMYDTTYKCIKCGQLHEESADNSKTDKPRFGCKKEAAY